MSRFLRSLRNKIHESFKKEGSGRDRFNDRLTETHSDRFNKVTRRKGFRAVANFFKIKF